MAFKEGVGIGTQLQIGDGAVPEQFTSLGRVKNISGPNLSVNIVEKTTLDDTYVRKVPGRIDGGDVSFDLELDPTEAGHKGIVAKIKGRAVHNFKIPLPDPWTGTTFSFSGVIKEFSPSVDDDGLSASVTIAVSGEPDFDEAP
jgi:hypothetical protein